MTLTLTRNPLAREAIYGGHLLAFGTASIAASSAILTGKTPTLPLLVMAYLFSFGAYMLNRGSEVSQDAVSNPTRTDHLRGRSKYLTAISLASFAAGYVLAFMTGIVFFLALLVPLGLAVLYSVGSKRALGTFGTKRLKEKLLVKNLAISLGWSLIPLLVGLYYGSMPTILLAFAPFIFMRLLSNTVFFDLRDVDADRRFEVRTIPVVYGSKASGRVMDAVDALSALYVVGAFLMGYFPAYALSMLLLPAYSFAYRTLARHTSINVGILCDVVADGEYLLWGPLLFLAGRVF